MIIELLIAIILGILSGIITGLTPGIHINLVAAISVSLAPALATHFPLILIAIFITCLSVTHNFIDMLPAIFLGAPDDSTALGVLPGHRYLLKGHGLMAVKLTIIGGIAGTLVTLFLFLPLQWLIAFLYTATRNWLFWILLAFTLFTVLRDKKRLWAAIIFALAGFLGMLTFRLPLSEPLLPMLSGMFGVATLLYSINEHNTIPEQKDLPYTEYDPKRTIAGSLLGTVGALITGLFPGISSAMAAALVSTGAKLGDHGFMVLIGSLGSASFVLSLPAFLAIEKARNGAMAGIVAIVELDATSVLMLLAAILVSTGVAAILTLWLGRKSARLLPRIPYKLTCWIVIAFIVVIVCVRAGWLGAIVLATSTAIGLLPAALKTARAQGMGCLVLPILLVV